MAGAPPCKVCSADEVRPLYQSQRYGFLVGRCTQCGVTFVLDQINKTLLKDMYSDDSSFQRFSNLMENTNVSKRHIDVLRSLRKLLPRTTRQPKIFDVGAGSGSFLNRAREFGFEVHGNELSDSTIRLARQQHGVELSPIPLEQDQRGDAFDIITMWGLIEHVLDPVAILQSAFPLLRGGNPLHLHTGLV